MINLICHLIHFLVFFAFQFLYLLLVFELDSGGRWRFDMLAGLFVVLVIKDRLFAGVDELGLMILIRLFQRLVADVLVCALFIVLGAEDYARNGCEG